MRAARGRIRSFEQHQRLRRSSQLPTVAVSRLEFRILIMALYSWRKLFRNTVVSVWVDNQNVELYGRSLRAKAPDCWMYSKLLSVGLLNGDFEACFGYIPTPEKPLCKPKDWAGTDNRLSDSLSRGALPSEENIKMYVHPVCVMIHITLW